MRVVKKHSGKLIIIMEMSELLLHGLFEINEIYGPSVHPKTLIQNRRNKNLSSRVLSR